MCHPALEPEFWPLGANAAQPGRSCSARHRPGPAGSVHLPASPPSRRAASRWGLKVGLSWSGCARCLRQRSDNGVLAKIGLRGRLRQCLGQRERGLRHGHRRWLRRDGDRARRILRRRCRYRFVQRTVDGRGKLISSIKHKQEHDTGDDLPASRGSLR